MAKKMIKFLAPMDIQLPDSFKIEFEAEDNGIAKVKYEESFKDMDEEVMKKTLKLVKERYNLPGAKIHRNKNKVTVTAKCPVALAIGTIFAEVLAQAIYYGGKEGVKKMLEYFPEPETYISPLPTTEAGNIFVRDAYRDKGSQAEQGSGGKRSS